MVVNSNKTNTDRVKFISYDGDYPNLCSGVLTLEIDGKEYKFGHHYLKHHYDEITGKSIFEDESPENPNFNAFWHSGGWITDDYEAVCREWEIDAEKLPEQFRELAPIIDTLLNENVEYGCCGGCI